MINQNKEFDLKEFFKILHIYKWLVLATVVFSLLLINIYLFFTPSIYKSSAIIEVNVYDKKSNLTDDLLQNLFHTSSLNIEKEIQVLKTFHINRDVIDKINFQTKFYKKDKYKLKEIYGEEIPFQVNNISMSNVEIIGKTIKITPSENGFQLSIEQSFKERIQHMLFGKTFIQFPSNIVYKYNTFIQTDFISFTVDKRKDFKSIYLKFNGDSYSIYNTIVQNNLHIQQLNINAPLIEISYNDNIPQRATAYANTLVNSFLEQGMNNKLKINNKILNFINQQLEETKIKFTSYEKSLEEYKVGKKIIDPSLQTKIIIKELSRIEIQVFENNLKKKLVSNSLNILNKGVNISSIAPALAEFKDKATNTLIELLTKLELQENKLSQEYTKEFPKLLQTRKDIETIRQKIYFNIKNLQSTLADKAHKLSERKKYQEKNLHNLPTKETKLMNLNRYHEVYSTMLGYLLKKQSENNILKVANISDYKIIENAYLPTIPIKPRKSLLLILSVLVGLIVSILFAILHHKLHRKINDVDDVRKQTALNIYGILPKKKQKNIHINVFESPKFHYAESYRTIRRDLKLLSRGQAPQTILLTSIHQGEGKSEVAANLSAICQLAGAKTIIIDINFRLPNLQNYFHITEYKGMSRYLSDVDSLEESIIATDYTNLDVIPAGPMPSNPSELLLSSTLKTMIEQLKKKYDYIIIDTASINSLSDTLFVMQYTDINLFVLRKNHSQKKDIQTIKELSEKYYLRNVGLILNEFNLPNEK